MEGQRGNDHPAHVRGIEVPQAVLASHMTFLRAAKNNNKKADNLICMNEYD